VSGITDELFVYLSTDDDGDTGVVFMETAGAAKIPLVAENRRKAQSLQPLAEHLATTMGRTVTLAKFSRREDLESWEP
jgi:hypothetical protein